MRKTLALVLVAVVAAGCTHRLPPPAVPGPPVPVTSDQPIPAGMGRLYVDVVDGPSEVATAEVQSILVALPGSLLEASALTTQPLCASPCMVDLPLGRHTLAFPVRGTSRRLELADVLVGARPIVYRRALGSYSRPGAGHVLGVVAVSFGGMSFVTGAALLPIGLATDHSGMSLAGGITLAAGALLVATGIFGMSSSPAYEQPGSGASYDAAP